MEHGLLKRYALWMEDKMAGAFGRAKNYGRDGPNLIYDLMLTRLSQY